MGLKSGPAAKGKAIHESKPSSKALWTEVHHQAREPAPEHA
jgi:hypothetical protein